MPQRKDTIIAIAILSGLSACGGGGTMNDGAGNARQTFEHGPSFATFDASQGLLSVGSREIGRTSDEVMASKGNAWVTRNAASDSRVAQASSSSAHAFGFATYNSERLSGTLFSRDSVPSIPTGGTASYSGDYAGVVVGRPGASNQYIHALTTGDARLAVDFNDDNVSGRISNRQVFRANSGTLPGASASDIVLQQTSLSSDGLFSGTTALSAFTQSGTSYTATSGSYDGALAGADGSEAVGVLSLSLSAGTSTDLAEHGAFALTD